MSKPGSIYVLSMRSIFQLQPQFYRNQSYNPIKTDTLVFSHFLEYLLIIL